MLRRWAPAVLIAVLFCFALNTGLALAESPSARRPGLVLAFYYAWYDEDTWKSPLSARPDPLYSSADRAAMKRHIDWAVGAGIDALVLAWLGPSNPTDDNLAALLSLARGTTLRISLYFETTSPFFRSQEDVVRALRYTTGKYLSDPAWLRVDGRPVLLFWRPRAVPLSPGQSPVDAWRDIRNQIDPDHTAIWLAEGDDFSFLEVFDGIHPYSIAWSSDPAGTLANYAQKTRAWIQRLGAVRFWVATVMPGYDDRGTGRAEAFARDREGGGYYRRTWEGALATDPDMVIITSFNEWPEGSAIEPSVNWGNLYLDITREYAALYKAGVSMSRTEPITGSGSSPALPDYDIPNGHFFSQTGGSPGQGYRVTNDDGVLFWRELQRLGGVTAVGYPLSERFVWQGFITQIFQKAVFQWRPEAGHVSFVNVFDDLHAAGKDPWLLAFRSIPPPLDANTFDAGRSWAEIVRARLDLLNANPAIRARYYAAPDPLLLFGLPTSRVEDMGNHYAIRLQRAVIQQWKEDVPWAQAGEVTVANGGEIFLEALLGR